jgi:hypothetical protein
LHADCVALHACQLPGCHWWVDSTTQATSETTRLHCLVQWTQQELCRTGVVCCCADDVFSCPLLLLLLLLLLQAQLRCFVKLEDHEQQMAELQEAHAQELQQQREYAAAQVRYWRAILSIGGHGERGPGYKQCCLRLSACVSVGWQM